MRNSKATKTIHECSPKYYIPTHLPSYERHCFASYLLVSSITISGCDLYGEEHKEGRPAHFYQISSAHVEKN